MPSSRAQVLEKMAERIIGPTFSRGNCVRASSSINYKSREGVVCYTAVFRVVTQRCVTTLKTAVWQTSEGGNHHQLEGKQDGLQKCTLYFLPSLITNCQGRRMAEST